MIMDLQQQFIKELEFVDKAENPHGILVKIQDRQRGYHPMALRNYLEWITGKPGSITELVVAANKGAAVAIFSSHIGLW